MEDQTQKDEAAMSGNRLTLLDDEGGAQPINSNLPDWYIDLVHQAMERSGEDLSFYLYGTTKKTPEIYDSTKSSVEVSTATENSAAKDKTTEQPVNSWPPEWYANILERAKEIPQEDRDLFPADFSENLDHYLYGMPKKTQ